MHLLVLHHLCGGYTSLVFMHSLVLLTSTGLVSTERFGQKWSKSLSSVFF